MEKKNISVVKIGLIYTISNIVVKGTVFLTTPIFARLMSKSEYGEFANISSWANIISIIVTLNLHVSIFRAKYDYEGEINKYISSILFLSNIVTLFCWSMVEVNISFFERAFDMNRIYIRCIFIYTLFFPALQLLMYKGRIYSKYKSVIFLTWINFIVSTAGSVFLVLLFDNKLLGRTIGNYLLIAIVDLLLCVYIYIKGKSVSIKYWKYALVYAIPLLPHEISLILLVSSDRIIIKRLCGAEYAALYSLAYTISTIASAFLSSLNQAWQPWLFDKLHEDKRHEIKKYSIPYTLLFSIGCCGVMLIGPEIIWLFGGEAYMPAKAIIPPVCLGIMFQFIYTHYVNVEYYEKKTGWISISTMIAAIVNVTLNFVFLPKVGYVAAAYTTAVGFLIMLFFHFSVVHYKTQYKGLYNVKAFLFITVGIVIVMCISLFLYEHTYIRLLVFTIYVVTILTVAIKKKHLILGLINGKSD